MASVPHVQGKTPFIAALYAHEFASPGFSVSLDGRHLRSSIDVVRVNANAKWYWRKG